MEPLQGTDQQGFLIKGPGLFEAAFENCKHIFGTGRIIPVERTHTRKFFFKRQNHS
jgi:hypothetical protein